MYSCCHEMTVNQSFLFPGKLNEGFEKEVGRGGGWVVKKFILNPLHTHRHTHTHTHLRHEVRLR